MNPRQRRGVLLMVVAAIGAVAVFASVFTYLNSQQDRLGEFATVLRLSEDVDAYQPVGEDSVERVQVPRMYFDPEVFITDLADVDTPADQELVAASHLEEGVYLQRGMVQPQPTLTTGEREIAIMVDAETGVAGKVQRGSFVDIYGTFQPRDHGEACAVRIITEVEVLDIGELRSQERENGGVSGVVPVTFRLDPQAALQLAYAEDFSTKLRLALVSADGGGSPGASEFCSGDFEDLAGGATPDEGETTDERPAPHGG
ncbi:MULTISPECIES: Flp pilus assembly protein CpaB [Nocardiopsidaceae]|uniref:Flp pilus assembly protein CpaB n=2 Tax=Nocardiopsidaceae TaxID=83676 RepID=A0ABY6YJA6_9ACTN|nr:MULTISPECIES: Flp pilus assembly protein CpaB [Nocardiopsaceae]MEE2054308.1 Flp pilus assembly protein CpaB [Nocardiopsis umidischolae]WAE72328.1 Flp pilus assembly protein CpaB [Streptomonospora nanhaiensis]